MYWLLFTSIYQISLKMIDSCKMLYMYCLKTYQIHSHIDINHINYRNKKLNILKMILFSIMRKNKH